MIKFKIDIEDALKRAGFNSYIAKKSGILSQDTLKKLKNEDTRVSLEAINRLCMILDMNIKDLITYEDNEDEKEKYGVENLLKK